MRVSIQFRGLPVILLAVLIVPLAVYSAGRGNPNANNVVIVLDASGSMDRPMPGSSMRKMDAAKAALREVLKRVPSDTQIGLLVFSGANVSNDWVYSLGPRDDAKLEKPEHALLSEALERFWGDSKGDVS